MVYSRKSRNINRSQIVGGAYNEIKINKIKEDKDKENNLSIVNIPINKSNNDMEEKLKTFVNFKFK